MSKTRYFFSDFFFIPLPRPPTSTLFPYTTLFRSVLDMLDGRIARMTGTASAFGAEFDRSEEHTSELQSQFQLVCRLLLEKKNSSGLTTRCGSLPVSSLTFSCTAGERVMPPKSTMC